MTKNKSQSKKSLISLIALIVVTVMCLLSVATLAYFTSQKSTSKEIKFGTIEVDVTSEGGNLVTTQSQNAVLMPGDTISVNFTVENKGEACYYLVYVSTPGVTGITLDLPVGLWAGDVNDLNNKVDDNGGYANAKVGSFAAGSADSGKSFTYENDEMTFDLVATGNEMQGKSITICVTVVAVQQANMNQGTIPGWPGATAEQYAYYVLDSMLKPSLNTPVVVNGVNYYYDTDGFAVKGLADNSLTNVKIEDVVMGREVTSIASSAFYGRSSLVNIELPSTLKRIAQSAFTQSGISSIVLPEGIETIAYTAFANCTSLGSITIPTSVTSISSGTFSGCTSLASIIIPTSVTSISSGAFNGCTGLQTVNYRGTEEQWNAMSIDFTAMPPYGNNAPLQTVIDNDGVVFNYAG